MKKYTVDVMTLQAGGYGDVSSVINIAKALAPYFNINIAFNKNSYDKFLELTDNNAEGWNIIKEEGSEESFAQVAAFKFPYKTLEGKLKIVCTQYNGESHITPFDGTRDICIVSGLGIEAKVKNMFYLRIPGGLYLLPNSEEYEHLSREDVLKEFDQYAALAGISKLEENGIEKLINSQWATFYSSGLGTNALFFKMLESANKKSDNFRGKDIVVFTFSDTQYFNKWIKPYISKFNFTGYNKSKKGVEQPIDSVEVKQNGSNITIINLNYVLDSLMDKFIQKSDLINISGGDGSTAKAFSKALNSEVPFLKFYNGDQEEFMIGMVNYVENIEKELELGNTTSRIIKGFCNNESLYQKYKNQGYNTRSIKADFSDEVSIDELAKLLYDCNVRENFQKVIKAIPQHIEKLRKDDGIIPELAENLPSVLDTITFILKKYSGGSYQNKEEFLENLKNMLNPDTNKR